MGEAVVERYTGEERRQNGEWQRLVECAQTLAIHEEQIKNIRNYQTKQNGSLQRLEDRFNSFYHLLLLSLLGMMANLIITLVRG